MVVERKPRWRVIVRGAGGVSSHESYFADLTSAQRYYDAIAIIGSTKFLDVRPAYRRQYMAVQREDM